MLVSPRSKASLTFARCTDDISLLYWATASLWPGSTEIDSTVELSVLRKFLKMIQSAWNSRDEVSLEFVKMMILEACSVKIKRTQVKQQTTSAPSSWLIDCLASLGCSTPMALSEEHCLLPR